MRDQRWAEGLTAGLITAAATAGALVVFGQRLGSVALPFDADASLLLGRASVYAGASILTTLLGVILHVAFGLVLGVGYAFEPVRARTLGVTGWLWSLTLAAAAFLLSIIVARLLGVGPAAVLPLGDRVVLAGVITLSLPLGMRFAFPSLRRTR